MSSPATQPSLNLPELAKAHLRELQKDDRLKPGELKMLQAVIRGQLAKCAPSDTKDDDPENDPSRAETWGPEQEIRSELIRWLCLNPTTSQLVDRRGILLHAAKINGTLDLSFASVAFPLSFKNCRIDELRLEAAQLQHLALTGSCTGAIKADRATVSADLLLNRGFHARGPVSLRNAQISGNLDCRGGHFENPSREEIGEIKDSGTAIDAAGIKVGGSALLRTEDNRLAFRAQGVVKFNGAQIEGDLDCGDAVFENQWQSDLGKTGVALDAATARINGRLLLRGVSAEGRVNLYAAQTRGELNCDGGHFTNPPPKSQKESQNKNNGIALAAGAARIGGQVLCRKGFIAKGAVSFYGAQIEGDLNCEEGIFDNKWSAGVENSGEALQVSTARINGHVIFRDGFSAEGMVRLYATQVRGELHCDGGHFSNPPQGELENPSQKESKNKNNGIALAAGAARIGGQVLCRKGFIAKGTVSFYGAQIEGDLNCEGATIQNSPSEGVENSGEALQASGIRVNGHVFLNKGFTAEGLVRLYGAQIKGDLNCSAGRFRNPAAIGLAKSGSALLAGVCNVQGNVSLRADVDEESGLKKRFRAEGLVSFYGAQIGGDLTCDDADLLNPVSPSIVNSGIALEAGAAKIGGHFTCGRTLEGFNATGSVRLSGAQINGDLSCSGRFSNPARQELPTTDRRKTGLALNATGVRVKGRTLLRDGFTAVGAVLFIGAQLEGDLDFSGASLSNSRKEGVDSAGRSMVDFAGTALSTERARIKGNVFLRFFAVGSVRLVNTHIEGDLDCHGAHFEEFVAQRATITSGFSWRSARAQTFDFKAAKVGFLNDDTESWDATEGLFIDGFVYDRILGDRDVGVRLEWLAKQGPRTDEQQSETQRFFPTQPYRQLAKVLKEEGDDRGARRVMYQMEVRRLDHEEPRLPARIWSWTLRNTIGYGYYPGRAVFWLLGLVAMGWILYGQGFYAGQMAPTEVKSYHAFRSSGFPLPNYQRFFALVYSADNSFPLIHLGQNENWAPNSATSGQPQIYRRDWADGLLNFNLFNSRRLANHISARGLLIFRWFQILLGWLLATLFLAGVSGVTRKE